MAGSHQGITDQASCKLATTGTAASPIPRQMSASEGRSVSLLFQSQNKIQSGNPRSVSGSHLGSPWVSSEQDVAERTLARERWEDEMVISQCSRNIISGRMKLELCSAILSSPSPTPGLSSGLYQPNWRTWMWVSFVWLAFGTSSTKSWCVLQFRLHCYHQSTNAPDFPVLSSHSFLLWPATVGCLVYILGHVCILEIATILF
jgi:hypothetical protein